MSWEIRGRIVVREYFGPTRLTISWRQREVEMLLYLQSDAQRWARVGWREKKGLAYPVAEVILKRAGYRAQGLSWAGWLHLISWHYLENDQLAGAVGWAIVPKLKPKVEFITHVRGKLLAGYQCHASTEPCLLNERPRQILHRRGGWWNLLHRHNYMYSGRWV